MEIKLNKEIYDIHALNKCINAYKSICNIDVSSTEQYYEINIFDCLYDEKETIYEFCNYLIAKLSEDY